MKNSTEERNLRWRKKMEILCLLIEQTNAKILFIYWAMYRFNAFPIKISQWHYFYRIKIILKFVWKHNRLWIAKVVLRKKNKAGNITLPCFKLLYKATATKTVLLAHTDTHINQWKRENPVVNPHRCGQLFYSNGGKNMQWEKTLLLQIVT